MYRPPFAPRPLHAAALLLGATLLQPATAATLVRYDFDDANNFANIAENVAPHLTASIWTSLNGTLIAAAGNPGTGFALSARSFNPSNSLSIVLTPEAGHMLRLDHVSFDLRASPIGPTAWRVTLNNTDITAGRTHTTFTTESVALNAFASSAAVRFGLLGSGASSNAGTLRLDNVVFDGTLTTVPLPGAVTLFASALLGGARRFTRRGALKT